MHPILFKIGGFTFYTHGLLAVVGIVVGAIILSHLAKKSSLNRNFLFDNVVYAVLFGIIGARLTYYFIYSSQFQSLSDILKLWQGGLVSYGGFILGGIAMWILFKIQKQPVLKWFDLAAIAFFAGLFFGRLGNLFAGEYAGFITTSRFALGGVIPVTLYEGIMDLGIFFALWLIYRRISSLSTGIIFSIGLIVYGIGRFVIDFWRDETNLLGTISLGQLASLAVVILGTSILIPILFKRRRNEII